MIIFYAIYFIKKIPHENRQDISKEVNILLKCDHPNIVKIYGFCKNGPIIDCLVMEYLDKGDLLAFLK